MFWAAHLRSPSYARFSNIKHVRESTMRIFAFLAGVLFVLTGGFVTLYVYAFASMVNPRLAPADACWLTLQKMFAMPEGAITCTVLLVVTFGIALMLFSIAWPRSR
jgi:hypothetical protein